MSSVCCPAGYSYGVPSPAPGCSCYTIQVIGDYSYEYAYIDCSGHNVLIILAGGTTLNVCASTTGYPDGILVGVPPIGAVTTSLITFNGPCSSIGGVYSCSATSPGCFAKDGSIVSSIECPCCPTGYTYVSAGGYYLDLITKTYLQIVGYNPSLAYNSCYQVQRGGFLIPGSVDTIPCPCCPKGYEYNSSNGLCSGPGASSDVPTIPCIPCVCVPPPPPPTCVDCTTNQGSRVSYIFDNTRKFCTSCNPMGEQQSLGTGADTFIPIQLLDPIINFTLRT